VAVVDTGVDPTHPDLAGQLVPGATFAGCPANQRPSSDGNSKGPDGQNNGDEHGTQVAGIIAAATNNGTGIAGVAPNAKIMPVKVLEARVRQLRGHRRRCHLGNQQRGRRGELSLGGLPGTQLFPITGLDTALSDAIAYARSRGVLTVAAAGNSATPLCSDHAFTDDMICVAATDRNELKSYYSELPVKPDLKTVAAPGGAGLVNCDDDIWSTVPTGTGSASCGQSAYDAYAGTSMATPHVAGEAALLYAQGRNVSQVETALLTTARQPVLGVRGVYTPVYGYGIVDAQAAVAS